MPEKMSLVENLLAAGTLSSYLAVSALSIISTFLLTRSCKATITAEHAASKDYEHRITRIHFFYVSANLGAIIVMLMTISWTPEPSFTSYIGNAATLTSLVLAVVAIFYSYISNNNLQQSLGNIASVATSVEKSESNIRDFSTHAQQSVALVQRTASELESASATIETGLATLDRRFLEISTQTARIEEAVSRCQVPDDYVPIL
jgi:hypothetical protein